MPCWTKLQTWQTRTASLWGTALSASSWYYIFSTPLQACKKMCGFTALMGKKKVIWILKIFFYLCFFQNSYTATSQYFFHSVLLAPTLGMQIARGNFFPSFSLGGIWVTLGGIWVRFLRMLDQKTITSLPAATDNRINQAAAKGSCLFWEDNINELLCTMDTACEAESEQEPLWSSLAVVSPTWSGAQKGQLSPKSHSSDSLCTLPAGLGRSTRI